MAPAIDWQVDALHLWAPAGGAFDVFSRDHTVVQDPLRSVNVAQKAVNGLESLNQAPLEGVPIAATDQSRQWIEGQDPFTPLQAGIVQTKRGSEAAQQLAGGGMAAVQLLQAHLTQGVEQRSQIGARR